MRRIVEYEINANNRRSIHTASVNNYDTFKHAGIEIVVKRGWQRAIVYGTEIMVRVLREWAA